MPNNLMSIDEIIAREKDLNERIKTLLDENSDFLTQIKELNDESRLIATAFLKVHSETNEDIKKEIAYVRILKEAANEKLFIQVLSDCMQETTYYKEILRNKENSFKK